MSVIDPQTSHPAISEWAKTLITTLIGAGVGFVFAVASEVWKSNRTTKQRINAIERALYAEMSQLYKRLNHFTSQSDNLSVNAMFIKQLSTDSYKHAKSNPDLFYALPEAFRIDQIYAGLLHAQNMPALEDDTVVAFSEITVDSLVEAVRTQKIKIDLLRKASPKTCEEILSAVKAKASTST